MCFFLNEQPDPVSHLWRRKKPFGFMEGLCCCVAALDRVSLAPIGSRLGGGAQTGIHTWMCPIAVLSPTCSFPTIPCPPIGFLLG